MTDASGTETGKETLDQRFKRVARDSGLSEAAVRQGLMGGGDSPAPSIATGPVNPWSAGLTVLWIAVFVLGFIVIVIGAVLHATYSPDDGQYDNGSEELLFGAMFTTIGAVSFAVWLGARMVLWKSPETDDETSGA